MIKIGFADLYLGEWHADNYPGWIEKAAAELGIDAKLCYAWAKTSPSPVTGESTEEWCKKTGAVPLASLEELCEKSDAVVVLAPSNPEVHPELAGTVLPFGKPTYIDKTFAEDLAAAQAITDLAAASGTAFFSTSALRYASELKAHASAPGDITLTGGGSNLGEYIVHLAEMVICLGRGDFSSVEVKRNGGDRDILIRHPNGTCTRLRYSPKLGYGISSCLGETQITSDFFGGLIREMLVFFSTGRAPFAVSETLAVMTLRDAILSADKNAD